MQPQTLIPSTYRHVVALAAPCRLVNMYAEAMEGPARKKFVLRSCPGMSEFSDVPSVISGAAGQTCRGFFEFEDTLYSVIGQHLAAIDSSGTATDPFAGNAIPGTGPVSVAINRTQALIATSQGDMLLTSSGLSQAGGTDFTDVIEFVGRAVGIPSDPAVPGRVVYTDADDFTSFQSDGFFNAEAHPDGSQAILDIGPIFSVFGTQTTELYYSTGDTTAPFALHGQGVLQLGIAANNSRASIGADGNNYGFFLAKSNQGTLSAQMINDGGQIGRISNNALESLWNSSGFTYSDAIGWCVFHEGHVEWVLLFPTEGRCFVYDLTMSRFLGFPAWRENQSGVNEVAGWDARHSIVAHDKILVGSTDGKVYSLDKDTHTDRGNKRLRMFHALLRASGGSHNRLGAIFAEMTTGVTPITETTESQIMLQTSKDGETWSQERWKGLGLNAKRKRDNGVRWGGFGSFTGLLDCRFKVTDACPVEVADVFADGAPGRPV